MTRVSIKNQEKQEAIEKLRETLKPGDTVYTIIRRVSASGMSRCISVGTVEAGEFRHLTYTVGKACGYTVKDVNGHDALSVSGCGMDMGFAVVYDMGRVMFPDGFDLPEGAYGRNGDTSGHDNDGGYALKQRWL